jgi:23S rRNA (uridine2552-2'-O)-methyltransferase
VGGDHRTRAARAQGYPARSVFKLEEIDNKLRLLAAGQRVIDLGAAPGSWSLYAARRVGDNGRVLAVDLKPIEQVMPANVTVIQADVFALESTLSEALAPYDVVLSDMAPNTSGDKAQNAARSYALFAQALQLALTHGRPGSHFCAKLFMGGDYPQAKREVAEAYEICKTIKPRGTRGNSVEVFLVGQGLMRASAPKPARE